MKTSMVRLSSSGEARFSFFMSLDWKSMLDSVSELEFCKEEEEKSCFQRAGSYFDLVFFLLFRECTSISISNWNLVTLFTRKKERKAPFFVFLLVFSLQDWCFLFVCLFTPNKKLPLDWNWLGQFNCLPDLFSDWKRKLVRFGSSKRCLNQVSVLFFLALIFHRLDIYGTNDNCSRRTIVVVDPIVSSKYSENILVNTCSTTTTWNPITQSDSNRACSIESRLFSKWAITDWKGEDCSHPNEWS